MGGSERVRASRQEPEQGPARGGPRQPRRASGSQGARRWKNNTVARRYPQGPQGHSQEETAPEKVKVEQSRGEPSGKLPEPGSRAERWESQGRWRLKTGNWSPVAKVERSRKRAEKASPQRGSHS